MTLLIRRNSLILLVLLAMAAAIVPAALGFELLRDAVELSPSEAKASAERLLLVGIVATSVLVGALVVTMAGVYRLTTALSRIADLHRVGGYDVEPALERLGDVGESISRMYGQLAELSARKSTRIAAMNSLLNVIMARSTQKLLVVDPRGTVFRTTPAALEFLDRTAGTVLGQPVNSVVPEVDIARARAAIGRTGAAWTAESTSYPVAVQPVLNDRGDIGYFVYYLGSEARLVVRTDAARDQPGEISPEEPILPPVPRPTRRREGVVSRLRRFLKGPPSGGPSSG